MLKPSVRPPPGCAGRWKSFGERSGEATASSSDAAAASRGACGGRPRGDLPRSGQPADDVAVPIGDQPAGAGPEPDRQLVRAHDAAEDPGGLVGWQVGPGGVDVL